MHFSCFLLFCVCWLWACVCVLSCVSSCSFSFNPFPFLFFLCVAFLNFFCFHFVCIFLVVFKTFFNKLLINNWKVFEIKMCMANDLPLRFLSFFSFLFFFLISFIFCLLFCSCFFFLLVLCIFFLFRFIAFCFCFYRFNEDVNSMMANAHHASLSRCWATWSGDRWPSGSRCISTSDRPPVIWPIRCSSAPDGERISIN